MPVFMDTGGGDIYAAETKEACLAAMRKDSPDHDYEKTAYEIPGATPIGVENEDGTISHELSTLEAEYTNLGYGYCIASTNC